MSLFVCRDARGSQWQLGPLPPATGRFTLIGWRLSPEPVDGGVPEPVARVLAAALTSVARITFLCSEMNPASTNVWTLFGGNQIRALTGRGFAARITAKLRGMPPRMMLISTRRPETVIGLFDDGGFPWWMQGQVVLLSKPDAPPPEIDAKSILQLTDNDWTQHAAALTKSSIQGVLRPGVDGDVAGLLSLTDTFEQVVLVALERETRQAGFEWALLPETEFARR